MSINKLIKIAGKSDHKRYKHGAIIIRGGAIVSSGYNHGFKHAEIHALEKLWPGFAARCTLITLRLGRERFGNSRPCDECYQRLREVGIDKIIYSDGRGIFVTERI